MKALLLSFIVLFPLLCKGQELFPVADNASSVPKGALGVRVFDEGYKEIDVYRNLSALKLLYGVTSRLSVAFTGDISNIHQNTLPFDFITHVHGVTGGASGSTNTPLRGIPYPFIFNSADVYAKYRLFTSDQKNRHIRVAAYAEGSDVVVPSHVAEPDLLMHTSGFGAGAISTYLNNHFAVSLTGGFILPFQYKGNTYDNYGGIYPTTIDYGKAINYALSFGYLLYPRQYKNYRQTNINIYCEFAGKAYQAARIWQKDGPYEWAESYQLPITTPILKAGGYLDVIPGIQLILNSTYRVEVSLECPFINQSYDHLYPFYVIGVQRYFFFNHHS